MQPKPQGLGRGVCVGFLIPYVPYQAWREGRQAPPPFPWEREWSWYHLPLGHKGGPLGRRSAWPEKLDLGRA